MAEVTAEQWMARCHRFRHALRRGRAGKGFSYRVLARVAGVEHTGIYRVETSSRIPAYETADKIAAALDTTLGEMIA